MSRISKIGQMVSRQNAPPQRTRKRAARPERKPSSLRCPLRVERLEDRTVPSTLPGSTFEIDGNLIVNGAGALDWANAPQLATATDLQTGQGDNSFGQGTKENTPVPSVVNGSIPNNKS